MYFHKTILSALKNSVSHGFQATSRVFLCNLGERRLHRSSKPDIGGYKFHEAIVERINPTLAYHVMVQLLKPYDRYLDIAGKVVLWDNICIRIFMALSAADFSM